MAPPAGVEGGMEEPLEDSWLDAMLPGPTIAPLLWLLLLLWL